MTVAHFGVAANVVWATVLAGWLHQPVLLGQTPDSLEWRMQQVEKRLKQLDPAFEVLDQETAQARLARIEAKLETLLAAKAVNPEPRPAIEPVIAAAVPTVRVEVPADQETRLPVAGYMDFHANKDRGDPMRPDFHRFVLLFGHSFSSRIKFWSELEIERSLVEGGEPTGELAVEQAYLDFFWKPALSFRAGMLLTPVGIVNERHEPPSFHGVERPFVETVIVPTTWRELGAGLTGDLGRGFRYRAYVTSSLNARFFDAERGIAGGKSSGFEASMRNPAKVARLEFGGVRRLMLGTSVYTGHTGYDVPGINPRVNIFNFDGRYMVNRFDFRGLFARTWVSRTAELNGLLERRTGVNPNVGSQMLGWYFEPAYHVFKKRYRNDLAFFTRYEKYNTQHRMAAGFDALGEFDRSSWLAGITFKPVPDVAIKFDYSWNRNRSLVVRPVDGINLGIGWWF